MIKATTYLTLIDKSVTIYAQGYQPETTFQTKHKMAMAGKKIWRDAATLILTAKAPAGKSLPSSFTR